MNNRLNNTIRNCREILDETADDELLFNNANKPSERFSTQRDMLAGEVNKYLVLEDMPDNIRVSHEVGDIHFHDADYAAQGYTNCCLINLADMLDKGTIVGNASIESPKSITTAAAITSQIIAQVSSHQYGGQSIDNIDIVLAPYVRKSYDKHLAFARRWLKNEAKAAVMATEMTEKEVYDACQALEYECNSLYNSNGQTPFVTFGFGLGETWESRLVQRAILEVRMSGLGADKRTAIFPKLVFAIKKGLNAEAGDPNYDIKQLAIKCTSERIYPDYVFYDKVVEVTGDFKFPMGCRSFLGSVPSGETSGRNNLGVVTVNLPRIAIESEGDRDKFFEILKERVEIAIQALNWRISKLEHVQAKAAPILYMHGAFGLRLPADEYVLEHLRDRASVSLGYIGCNEMLQFMFGKDVDVTSDSCVSFVAGVLQYMKFRAEVERRDTGFGFSLYGTPSESLCDRFNRLDKEWYPECMDILSKGYYTNSHHLDVEKKVSPNIKIDYESNFTILATGGCITYVELPDMKKHLKALEWVIDYASTKVHYFGANSPIDSCYECGFLGETIATENGFSCPHCGNHNPETIEVTRRVSGYLGNPGARPFNPGKQHEVMGRVKHADVRAK